MRPLLILLMIGLAMSFVSETAFGEGFALGETKAELKLDYDVAVTDHGTGRVTVVLTIADPGRLEPLRSVDLVVRSEDRTNHVDLSLSVALTEVDGKQVARVHLHTVLAERAEIQLRTATLDGKHEPLTWYYHAIPMAAHLETPGQAKASPQLSTAEEDRGLPASGSDSK